MLHCGQAHARCSGGELIDLGNGGYLLHVALADMALFVGHVGWLCIGPAVKCEEVPLCCRGDGAARLQCEGSRGGEVAPVM